MRDNWSGSSDLRRAPAQSVEPRKIAIRCDPFTTRLDRQRREPSILDEISCRRRLAAQIDKNAPMPRTWLNNLAMWLLQQDCHERHDVRETAGLRKYARMCCQTNNTRQYLRRHAVRRFAIEHFRKPTAIELVIYRVCTKSKQQHIDIRKNHLRPSITSKSPAP